MSRPIRLGTRSSARTRWQAQWVADALKTQGIEVELIHISTTGDVTSGSLAQIGGQGLFTKEIQRALLANEIDLAVHSLKDLPTAEVPGLTLAALLERENPQDCWICPAGYTWDTLAALGANLNTSWDSCSASTWSAVYLR